MNHITNQAIPLFSKQATDDEDLNEIYIKELADASLRNGSLNLTQPICFDCFDKILARLGEKIKSEEQM